MCELTTRSTRQRAGAAPRRRRWRRYAQAGPPIDRARTRGFVVPGSPRPRCLAIEGGQGRRSRPRLALALRGV